MHLLHSKPTPQPQQKTRPPHIRVVSRETFKRLFDDCAPTYAVSLGVDEIMKGSGFASSMASPISTMSSRTLKSSWGSSNPSTPCTSRFLLDRSVVRDADNEDIIDMYGADEEDDSDPTPPVTPRTFGVATHVRVASGSDCMGSGPLPSPQIYPFHHYSPAKKISSGYDEVDLPPPTPSPTSTTFSDKDLSILTDSATTETEPELERLPAPVQYTELGTPEFTNPFSNGKPLKPLPRLAKKDFKPLSKKFLKSASKNDEEEDGLAEDCTAALLCRGSTKMEKHARTVEENELLPPPSPTKCEFSPYDRAGMSSSEKRMLRLMKELFPDVAMAGVKRPRREEDMPERPACIPRVRRSLSFSSTRLSHMALSEALRSEGVVEERDVVESDGAIVKIELGELL
ncbi:hypothetical protein VNI00_009860 [Paramarasmius palmivorus]|uniref:Uncharacterized protein n=1 Tax=Paramarasmius palmivorus TaxID=297713 RepID=A0AAW0CNF9_9AGAR